MFLFTKEPYAVLVLISVCKAPSLILWFVDHLAVVLAMMVDRVEKSKAPRAVAKEVVVVAEYEVVRNANMTTIVDVESIAVMEVVIWNSSTLFSLDGVEDRSNNAHEVPC